MKTQLQRKYYTESLRSNIETGMDFAIKDSLSGLYNRRYFDIHLPNMVKKAIDNNKNLYALMIDIDDFKI
ncbi:MAG UNVERIFIED_CONTAM: diguanylate cyclase [Rickettsiaceae bacterium]|jgi:two-component system cell cycle response regulator